MRYLLISRYVIQEVMLATTAILLVLLLISLSNAFVGYLGDAAQGLLSVGLVFYVLILNVPFLASFLLPMAFFFGIILGLGRLYADAEMTALRACGYGTWALFKTLLLPAAFVMALTAMLNFYWAPQAMHQLARVLAEAEHDLLARLVLPGRFQATPDGRYVIYVQAYEPDSKKAQGVFIAQQNADEQGSNIVTSQTAYQWFDEDTQTDYVVLENGQRYFVNPGKLEQQVMHFSQYGVRMVETEAEYRIRERILSTEELLQSPTAKSRAELQWRFSLSASVLVMALLALLIAQLKPRQGKYANALPAILIIIVYVNVLILAKGWVEDSKGILGWTMYWTIALGLAIGLFWMGLRTRFIQRKKRTT